MKLNSSFFYFKQAQSFGPCFEYHVAFQDQSDCIGEDGTNWSYFTLVYDFAVWYIVLKELHHRKCCENWFFSIKAFFTDTGDSQDSSGREGKNLINLFLPSSPSFPLTNIQTFFPTSHVSWPPRIFNCTACIYQTATRWDLPPWLMMEC